MKNWKLNLTTLSLTQVAKFDYGEKGVIFFEAENYLAADHFVNELLHSKPVPLVPSEVEEAIMGIIN